MLRMASLTCLIGMLACVPAAASTPKFTVKPAAADGQTYYVVVAEIPGVKRCILEVLSHAGRYTKEERANKIAERMQRLSEDDPSWADRLRLERIGSEKYVGVAGSGRTTILVTADAGSVAQSQAGSKDELAKQWIDHMKRMYSSIAAVDKGGAALPATALQLRMDGDALAAGGSSAAAMDAYRKALAIDPHFVAARTRLAGLVARAGEPDRARQILQDGLKGTKSQAAKRRLTTAIIRLKQ